MSNHLFPIVTRIGMDAGANARPLVWLAHAIHHLDGDVDAATALVDDLFADNTPLTADVASQVGGSRYPF